MQIIKKYMDKILEYFLILLFIIMFFVVLIQVFTRFVLNNPASWTEEVARYLMIWMGLVGAGVSLKYGLHMSLEVFHNKLSGKALLIVRLLCISLTAIVGVIFLIYGYKYMMVAKNRVSMALQFPMIYAFAVLPITGVVILMNCIELMVKTFNEKSLSQQKTTEHSITQ